jgi:hypothetical protein
VGRDAELERKLAALIEAAEWPDVVPRLQTFTRSSLSRYGEEEGRRWQTITHAYVVRAVERVLEQRVECARFLRWDTLFELLCAVIRQLIDEDERTLQGILETTDWNSLIPRVIAHTVDRLGPSSAHGKSPSDYVYEAVLHLFTRRRHYPHYRDDLSLFTFLCHTVHGMRTNDLAKSAAEGQHLSIAADGTEEPAAGELRPDALPATTTGDAAAAAERAEDFFATLEPDLRAYARLLAEERYATAKQYADALHVSVQTIRNYDRKLKRRRLQWDAPPAR